MLNCPWNINISLRHKNQIAKIQTGAKVFYFNLSFEPEIKNDSGLMLFGGFGCEPGYENCGYDQESYVTYVDTRGATTYQNEKLRRVFKFIL